MNTGATGGWSEMKLILGVIAEERGDINVLEKLTEKIIQPNKFSIKPFVSHGSGKLRNKCSSWISILSRRGCTHFVVLHDLDDKELTQLQQTLSTLVPKDFSSKTLVLIPVREIESWLMCDPKAIMEVFGMRDTPKLPSHPEAEVDAKKALSVAVYLASKKQYVNTIHNARIAEAMALSALSKCESFGDYPKFLNEASGRRSSKKRKKKATVRKRHRK